MESTTNVLRVEDNGKELVPLDYPIPVPMTIIARDGKYIAVHIGTTRWYDSNDHKYKYGGSEYRVYQIETERFGLDKDGEFVSLLISFPVRIGAARRRRRER